MNELVLANGGRLQAPDHVLIQKANQEIANLVKELKKKQKEIDDLRHIPQALQ
jgi:hypothetical protein